MNDLAPISLPSQATPDDGPSDVIWWTPSGWITAPPPEPYCLARAGNCDFERFGYGGGQALPKNEGSDLSGLQFWWQKHADGHAMVNVSEDSSTLAEEFFVARAHWPAFLLREAPALVIAASAQDAVFLLENLVRTATMFVRHGHGEDVIDPAGLFSQREERAQRRRFRENDRRRRPQSGTGT